MNLSHMQGLSRHTPGLHTGEREKDPEQERYIQAYADAMGEREKVRYQPAPGALEGVKAHIARVRQQSEQEVRELFDAFEKGYEVIVDALKDAGDPVPTMSAGVEDSESLTQAIQEGTPIYEDIGFSPGTMNRMFEVLNNLFQLEEYEKVRIGFSFMTTICPITPEYWSALGFAEMQLKNNDKAEAAFQKAQQLDPSDQDTYLALMAVYADQGKYTEAESLCDQAISYARENSFLPGAGVLEQTMLEAKLALKSESKEET